MKTISGFTFIHNAIDSGYPIIEAIQAVQPYVDEVVIVDMQSTDGTRDLLERMVECCPKNNSCLDFNPSINGPNECNCGSIKIIDGYWGKEAGETLRQAHLQYKQCSGDIIIHFEADEVYSNSLIKSILSHARAGHDSLSVYRLQLEQNFQRCRWYPEPVHRVFSKLGGVRKEGHTTNQADSSFLLTEKNGYLWDCTNCFRDNWFNRVQKQAELRGEEPQYLLTPIHTLHKNQFNEVEAKRIIENDRVWRMTNTPFDIPAILKPLVGMTKYEPS